MRARVAIAAALSTFALGATADAAITPLSIYGAAQGGAAGQLDAPLDVSVDPRNGDVYVADDTNSRIDVFAPDGSFLRAFGANVIPGGATGAEVCTAATGCQQGAPNSGPGALNGVEGVEVAEGGAVFVAEYDNQRISTFTREGQFVRAFGIDVVPGGGGDFEVCTVVCKPGVGSGQAGSVNTPWAMSIGPVDDLLYVTGVDGNRIDVFTQNGEFVHAFGKDVIPSAPDEFETCTTATGCQIGDGSGDGGVLAAPEGIDFDPAGNALIAEYGNDRISAVSLSPAPAFLGAFGHDVIPGGATGYEVCTTACQGGDGGSADGQFASPQGVAVDLKGTLYVADSSNQRVQMLNLEPTPTFAGTFGADVDPLGGAGFELCLANCKAGIPSDAIGGFDDAYAPDADCHGSVYVTDVNNHRIQRFGEPGVATGPCEFTFAGSKRDKQKGTATLTAIAPAPGTLTLSGKGIKARTVVHAGLIGPETLKLKTSGKTKRKLKKKGKAKVNATIGFDPAAVGADSETTTAKVKLKRKRKR